MFGGYQQLCLSQHNEPYYYIDVTIDISIPCGSHLEGHRWLRGALYNIYARFLCKVFAM
jgi:hypothetical protein